MATVPSGITIFCTTPELLVMPAPLKKERNAERTLIMKGLAPGSKTRPSRVTSLDSETLVLLEVEKVAVSVKPFGTVCGVQLAAVFQSPLVGSRFQVALPAELDCVLRSMKSAAKSAVTANDRMEREVALSSVMAGCCCMMIDFIGFAFSSPEINADFASES